jgi:hypothetical protein
VQDPQPGRGQAIGVEERTTPQPTDGEDRERFAHIIFAPGCNAEAVVLEARITGTPVTALCGKRWVPSRDPQRYPLCPTCREVLDQLPRD